MGVEEVSAAAAVAVAVEALAVEGIAAVRENMMADFAFLVAVWAPQTWI